MQSLMNSVDSLRRRLRRPKRFRPDAARDVFLVTYPRSGTTWISCVAAMRDRKIKGNSGIGPELNFIGAAKAGNWKQLQSGDGRDAISILEEFARDAMQRAGYKRSAEAMGQ